MSQARDSAPENGLLLRRNYAPMFVVRYAQPGDCEERPA